MTIKQWLIDWMIQNELQEIKEYKSINAPQVYIDFIENTRIPKIKKGQLGICHLDRTTNKDLYDVEVQTVYEVCGVRGGNIHIVFNKNIHLLRANKFMYLRTIYDKKYIIKQKLL